MAQGLHRSQQLAFPKKPLPVLPPGPPPVEPAGPLPLAPNRKNNNNNNQEQRRTLRKPINLDKEYAAAETAVYQTETQNFSGTPPTEEYYEYADANGEPIEPDGAIAIALWNFNGERETDLNFNKGDKIKIIRRFSNGWWEGEINDVIGDFPCNFVEVLEESHINMNMNMNMGYYEDNTLPAAEEVIEPTTTTIVQSPTPQLTPPQFSPNVNVPLALRSSNPTVPLKKDLPIKEGFLTKKGHKRRNWKVRYFVLETNLLSYYKSPQDYLAKRKPKGSIILQRSTMVRVAPEMKRSNCFTVSGGLGLLYITAPTGEEMVLWMEKISAAKVKL